MDAEPSGTDVMKQPIFGSCVTINDKKYLELSIGLPLCDLHKDLVPKLHTRIEQNLHLIFIIMDLNMRMKVDGTAMEIVFGKSTLLGPKVTFQFPEITNNQSLLWFHSHNMFISMELIYAGIVGLLQIVDKETKWL